MIDIQEMYELEQENKELVNRVCIELQELLRDADPLQVQSIVKTLKKRANSERTLQRELSNIVITRYADKVQLDTEVINVLVSYNIAR